MRALAVAGTPKPQELVARGSAPCRERRRFPQERLVAQLGYISASRARRRRDRGRSSTERPPRQRREERVAGARATRSSERATRRKPCADAGAEQQLDPPRPSRPSTGPRRHVHAVERTLARASCATMVAIAGTLARGAWRRWRPRRRETRSVCSVAPAELSRLNSTPRIRTSGSAQLFLDHPATRSRAASRSRVLPPRSSPEATGSVPEIAQHNAPHPSTPTRLVDLGRCGVWARRSASCARGR
jgi:hypothetical protein